MVRHHVEKVHRLKHFKVALFEPFACLANVCFGKSSSTMNAFFSLRKFVKSYGENKNNRRS